MADQHADFLAQFFEYKHLPLPLQDLSRPFGEMAENLTAKLPPNPERTAFLRKLLEAKDCAVRCMVAETNRIRRETEARIASDARPTAPGGE